MTTEMFLQLVILKPGSHLAIDFCVSQPNYVPISNSVTHNNHHTAQQLAYSQFTFPSESTVTNTQQCQPSQAPNQSSHTDTHPDITIFATRHHVTRRTLCTAAIQK